MQIPTPFRSLSLVLAIAFAGVLAGCAPTPDAPAASTPAETGRAAELEPTPIPTPEACAALDFAPGSAIAGTSLADCLMAAMSAAGTGAQRVDTDVDGLGATSASFRWQPAFGMLVQRAGVEMVIDDQRGWLYDGARWVAADPNSDDEALATAAMIGQSLRPFADPRNLGQSLAMVETWTVLAEDEVPAADAARTTAWHLEPAAPIPLEDVVLTDVALWIGADGLPAYYTATEGYEGQTATTSNTFLQWGGPVDIPTPSEE
ncbi:hypothetical protein [Agromyces archimandritae]|uniref:LppX_LprAFG lipoprotein n=1 Tax=Agromyces archimandritae TaxID=2781962 RepID=A0A975FKR3_9MICO|nr:hypothetical protein [Agromyces archimandritae]QTX03717.1 hypothetical protein G127AT_10265 [Agromyces archimandritae]